MPGLSAKTFQEYDNIHEPATLPTPGKFSYSNTNFTFLGLIVEAITNDAAVSQIRKRIIEPLHLTKTWMEEFEDNPYPSANTVPKRYHWLTPTFLSTAGICPDFSKPSTRPDLIDASPSNLSVEWTAGGYISHPNDLTTLALAVRNCDSKIISPASHAIMYQFQPAEGTKGGEIGHGIFKLKTKKGDFLGHSGSVLGFASTMYWSEEEDVALSLVGNVGTMHAGDVTSAAHVGLQEEFLELVLKLAKLSSGKST